MARTGETGGVSFSKSEDEEPVEVVGEGGMDEAALVGVVGEERDELLADLVGLRRERKATGLIVRMVRVCGRWLEGKGGKGKGALEVEGCCWPAAGLKRVCLGWTEVVEGRRETAD